MKVRGSAHLDASQLQRNLGWRATYGSLCPVYISAPMNKKHCGCQVSLCCGLMQRSATGLQMKHVGGGGRGVRSETYLKGPLVFREVMILANFATSHTATIITLTTTNGPTA